MSPRPIVSVVVAARDVRPYLRDAVRSALDQAVPVEVLVIDDGSHDGTGEVALALGDPRVLVLRHPTARGPSASRNRAIAMARGEWIAPLDADDAFMPGRLAQLMRSPAATWADVIADDVAYVPHGSAEPRATLLGQLSGSGRTLAVDPVRFAATHRFGRPGLHLGMAKPLIRRAFLRDHAIAYDERALFFEDFWLYLDCLLAGARFAVVPEPGYRYRERRPGALTGSDVLVRLAAYRRGTERRLARGDIRARPALARALAANLSVFRRAEAWHRVRRALSAGRACAALRLWRREPCALLEPLWRLRERLAG
ncbi:MAG TPA: glycosyltransferase family 2 protein [Planctomycetota bacterium]|nr:glycosyltransferase family 2 protein [Planctomycetota bacterium]